MAFFGKPEGKLAGRTALITGASRGIGAAVAEAFAREGAHVILLARTIGALEEIDDRIQEAGGKATLMPFDLNDIQKIQAIAPTIAGRFQKLDILVGNAAMLGALSPVALSDAKIYEEVFRLNFFANYHLIRALDPLLRGSDAGRAIFVTSAAARMNMPYWSAYAASKAALEVMVSAYAKEVSYSNLKVNILSPGIVATEMRAQAFPAEDQTKLAQPADIAAKFVALAAPDCTGTGMLVEAA